MTGRSVIALGRWSRNDSDMDVNFAPPGACYTASMSQVVHLKWGEQPPSDDLYLMVTRQGRIRGQDFYVRPCAKLTMAAAVEAAFASLDSALQAAQVEARRSGVDTIYVRLA
jgi:hypothetical protein